MKKHNEENLLQQTPPGGRQKAGKPERAEDFALHLAAMFRAELGEEDEELDPVLSWKLPPSEEEYRSAAAKPENSDELFRAVASLLSEEEQPAFDEEAPSREKRQPPRAAAQEAPARPEAPDDEALRASVERLLQELKKEPEAAPEAPPEAAQEAPQAKEPAPAADGGKAEKRSPERTEKRRRREERTRRREARPAPERRPAPEPAPAEAAQPREPAPVEAVQPPEPASPPAPERLVFFEPKQKKNSFFDPKPEPQPAALPEEPSAGRKEQRQSAQSAGADKKRDGKRQEKRRQTPRQPRPADGAEPGTERRRRTASGGEARPAVTPRPRLEHGDEPASEARSAAASTERFREITVPARFFTFAEDEKKELVLPAFDSTPFAPPQPDPTLDELFGPLGFRTAPPDADTSAVLTPRSVIPENAPSGGEDAKRGTEDAEASRAEKPETDETAQKAPEAAAPAAKRGWLRGLFRRGSDAASGRNETAAGAGTAPTPRPPEDTPAASGVTDEAPTEAPKLQLRIAAEATDFDPSEPWTDDRLFAAVDALLGVGSTETGEAPDESSALPEAAGEAPAEPERVSDLILEIEPSPEPEPVPAPEAGTAPEPEPVPDLFPEIDPIPEPETVPEIEPIPEPEPVPAPEAGTVPEPEPVPDLFPEIDPIPEPDPIPEIEPIPASVPAPAPELGATAVFASPRFEKASADSAPTLWDPLSLFEDGGEAPLSPAPLSRDTTGSLPSLEELFGPISDPVPPRQPPQRPARRERKRGWLLPRLRMKRETEDAGSGTARRERRKAGASKPEAPAPSLTAEPSSEAEALPVQPAPSPSEAGRGDASVPTLDQILSEAAALLASPTPEQTAAGADGEAFAALAAVPAQEEEVPPEPAVPVQEEEVPPAPAAPVPEEETPTEPDPAAEWDPLALFGGSASDAELPTWSEYLRSRSTAAETEAEPETLPMELADPASSPGTPASERTRDEDGQSALTLEDFLAAAVPAEETAEPQPEPTAPQRETERRHTLRFGATVPETISTVPENPDGLILTWAEHGEAEMPDILARSPDRRRQRPAAGTPAGRQRQSDQKPAKKRGKKEAQAPSPQPAPPAAKPERTPPEPVPSADVRPEEIFGEDARARRRAKDEPPEPLPPEEKSVLHPEEAYRLYAKPLDGIGSRLILTGLFTILSLFFTLYLAQRWTFLPAVFSGGTTVYVLLALLGVMVLINRRLYFREWRGPNGLRPELLIGAATLFTALDCFPAAKELRPPFTVVVGALLMVALWGRYDRGLALLTTVKVLRAEKLSAGVSEVQDITKGSRGLVRAKPDVERFMEKLETRDLVDRMLRIYTPVALIGGLTMTLLLGLVLKKELLWTGALVFIGIVPITGLLAFPRLFCLLAERLSGANAALCGYHGAEAFGGEHSILIGDDDIFPAGSLTLNGFKVYNGNPDRMIAYAAAAFRSSGSALDPVFEDLLVTHNGRHYTVDNFRFYDSGGIGASIMQDVVLLGSLDFMRRMGVHMDKGARVRQAVYMSLNGELAAVFAVRYTPPENLRRGLAAIAGNRHFKGILVTRTFLGTPSFLKVKFGIPTGAFQYPSTKERIRLSEAELKRAGAQGAILAKDSFSGFAQAAAGGRMLRSATLGAAVLTLLGGLIGFVLMGVLAALPAYETATAINLLLYTAAWLVPTLLLTAWGRHF